MYTPLSQNFLVAAAVTVKVLGPPARTRRWPLQPKATAAGSGCPSCHELRGRSLLRALSRACERSSTRLGSSRRRGCGG